MYFAYSYFKLQGVGYDLVTESCLFLAAVGYCLSASNSGSKLQPFFEIQNILKNNYLR